MSNKKKIWAVILLVCVILTLWQIPNFKVLWREYITYNISGQGKDTGESYISLINSEAAKADPEASDILNYLISKPDVNGLSTLVLKYPDNELFAFELSNQLLKTDATNPQAALNLASKLVTLKPENAHYRYLKACALLSLRTENIFEQAIDEIKRGNRCPTFEFAYSTYKKRVHTIIQETQAGTLKTSLLEPYEGHLYINLNRAISKHIQEAIKSSDQLSLLRLTDISSVIGDKLIEHAEEHGILMKAFFFIISASYPKLKYAKLSPDEAEQVRFQYARAAAVKDIAGMVNHNIFSGMERITTVVVASATAITIFIYIGACLFIVFVVDLIRKSAIDVKVSIKEYLQYGSCFICYLIFVSFLSHDTDSPFIIRFNLVPEKTNHLYLLALILPPILWIAFRVMSLLPAYDKKKLYRFWLIKTIVCAAFWLVILAMVVVLTLQYGEDEEWDWLGVLYFSLFCLALWTISVYGWFLIRLLPYKQLSRNRGVQLILFVAFLAGLNQLLFNYKWLRYLPTFLLIPCSVILIVHDRSGKIPRLIDALYHFFGKREPITTTRKKILQLLSPYMVILWLLFLVSIGSISLLSENLKEIVTDPLLTFKPLPMANRSTYESIVKRIDFSNVDNSSLRGAMNRSNVISYFPVLGPKDLPAILEKSKKAEPPFTDWTLHEIMERCPPDVRDIITNSLEEPESQQSLMSRAKSGDATVKPKLERLFDDNFSKLKLKSEDKTEGRANRRYEQRRRALGRCFDIISALAITSEPNETMRRFKDIFEKIDLDEFEDERLSPAYYLYKSINSLPRPQASRFFKTYLEKTGYSELSSKRRLSRLKDALTHFADTDIAEQIFIRTSCASLMEQPLSLSFDFNSIPFDNFREQLNKPRDMTIKLRKAISPYFSKSSIPILKKELNSDNPNLRAYVVWQLTKLGYEWSEQELKQLFTDKDWKVRLNTLFAMDKKSVRTALDDENPVVRVTAKLIVENK
ncbi:MAG: HEAT repeat domain-containing protein [Planctomycetota bacterium]|jgi:hypothetical protein